MNVTVVGSGYVGLVTGSCIADVGNIVVCLDMDEVKIALLNSGRIPIHEPGLDTLLARNIASGRLSFSTSYDVAMDDAELIFLAVGTPPEEDGSADLQYVLAASRSIGQRIHKPLVVVVKSTVPVGTADKVRAIIAGELAKRSVEIAFDVVSNPEFLKEGAALEDFMKPSRIVIGSDNAAVLKLMRQLYAPFCRNHEKIVEMDVRSAELTKYAANAMLATRISFMNELAGLAELLGADIESVRLGMGMDPRIGSHFLYAGVGYGGSCFPKDVIALIKAGAHHERSLRILQATEAVNEDQKHVLYAKLVCHFGGVGGLNGKTIALWGLSFKPNTDDMREAPSLVLIRALFAADCKVRAYDPVAAREARRVLVSEHGAARVDEMFQFAASAHDAVQDADALALVTEWQEFRSPDFHLLARTLRARVIFDGRNIYDPKTVTASGLRYEGIGRISQVAD
jgi:UDPglucose 6-dehydrogenase